MRTEWVIHIWGKERDGLVFTPQEKFHIDMIKRYDHSVFDKVLVNIAMCDINDELLFNFLKDELLNVFSDVKEVEIKKCQNDIMLCEYITFRPYVWDRIGEDVRVFYSHFKGYASNVHLLGEYAYPYRNININEFYWSYLMYRMSLDNEYVNEMIESFDLGKCVYCWCLFDKLNVNQICIPEDGDYYISFFRDIEKCIPNIEENYIEESVYMHSPGSFVWYNMKDIYHHIEDVVNKIININSDVISNSGRAPHFCELFIWRFLDIKHIQEQSFVNNIKKQFIDINNNVYTQIYCSKKICHKYIKDFNEYIIQNKLI